jgi:hypothetical protein
MPKIRTLQKLPAKKYSPKVLPTLADAASRIVPGAMPIPTRDAANLKKRSLGNRSF